VVSREAGNLGNSTSSIFMDLLAPAEKRARPLSMCCADLPHYDWHKNRRYIENKKLTAYLENDFELDRGA
jgi:hypothetical protein